MAALFRAKSGRILAILVSQCGDLQLAEDALQDALEQASEKWRANSTPNNPEAWLLTVAKRRLIDVFRATKRQRDAHLLEDLANSLTANQTEPESEQEVPDERLKLIFTCCHPALNQPAQVALTLKTLCGLSVREIARAFLVSETTMNQRLVRAKQKISKAGIAYRVPNQEELPARLDSVLAVVYLIYNESYAAFEGQTLTREELANEAIRLAEVLQKLLPSAEISGLLALMLMHQARSPARATATQDYIPLAEQDRSRWDQNKISPARTTLVAALSQGKPGKYQIQAAISALHCAAPSWEETDWQQIFLLYLTLYEIEPSPIVKLNASMASAHLQGESQAYVELQTLAIELQDYQPYFAARAELESKLGLAEQASASYERAIKLSKNIAERQFLSTKLALNR